MRTLGTGVLAAIIGACALPLLADDASCKQQLDEVLSELRDLRKLIESRSTPVRAVPAQPVRAELDVGDAPFLGLTDAPLTIVEFTDYECPFCERFYKETFPNLKKIYIDSGKLRFYVVDYPLTQIHKDALRAAQAAHCAEDQGRFWDMHDRMQGNRNRLEMNDLTGYAGDLGLNVSAFRECIDSGKYRSAVEESARLAESKGAQGTPAFVVGKSTSAGVDGQLVVGAEPFGTFDKILREFMK